MEGIYPTVWILAAVMMGLWALEWVPGYQMSRLTHILLAIVVISFLVKLIQDGTGDKT